MNALQTTQISGETLSLALAARRELEKVLKQKFNLWLRSNAWQLIPDNICDGVGEGAGPDNLSDILEQCSFHKTSSQQRSTVICSTGGKELLCVPVVSRGTIQLLLVGMVQSNVNEVACALADSIIESHRLKRQLTEATQQLDQCAFQITANFEELTWLRSLTDHFEVCSLDKGLAGAAQATLHEVRELIYAQEIFLFGLPITGDHTLTNMPDSSTYPLLAFDGPQSIAESAARDLLIKLLPRVAKQPIVWNSHLCSSSRGQPHEVRNYILAPVVKSQEIHGWLLAINKIGPLESPIWNSLEAQDRNLIEFGTTEAGLLSTMAVMLATHGKNVDLLQEKEALLLGVIRALVNTIDAKDAYTCGHSDRVALISKTIASHLGHSPLECEQTYMSGLLHDIGKIGVPDTVLSKPGKLTDEEFDLIKMHPRIGYEILKHLKPFAYVLPGVLHHHESYNGRGYPGGLVGEEIPLLGRIIAVADSYDAMTSSRTYRQGMTSEKAQEILRQGANVQWDATVIDAFFSGLAEIKFICESTRVEADRCVGGSAVLAHNLGPYNLAAVTTCAF